jgi:hypothetical protein
MIKHIVFWKIKPELDVIATSEEIKSKLEALRGNIAGLIAIEVGTDISNGPASFDVALYSELEDQQALQSYQVHPLHEAVKSYIGSVTTERGVVDYRQ